MTMTTTSHPGTLPTPTNVHRHPTHWRVWFATPSLVSVTYTYVDVPVR